MFVAYVQIEFCMWNRYLLSMEFNVCWPYLLWRGFKGHYASFVITLLMIFYFSLFLATHRICLPYDQCVGNWNWYTLFLIKYSAVLLIIMHSFERASHLYICSHFLATTIDMIHCSNFILNVDIYIKGPLNLSCFYERLKNSQNLKWACINHNTIVLYENDIVFKSQQL